MDPVHKLTYGWSKLGPRKFWIEMGSGALKRPGSTCPVVDISLLQCGNSKTDGQQSPTLAGREVRTHSRNRFQLRGKNN